jgi:hypothetical protein
MKLKSQTDTKINPDEQERIFDFDSASTDFKYPVLFKDLLQYIMKYTRHRFVVLLSEDKDIIIRSQDLVSGSSKTAQSDLIPSVEEEKQTCRTETAHIEKISQVEASEEIKGIFRSIEEETLEDELEDEFAKSLLEYVNKYEGIAINEIQHFILKDELAPELAEATLRILGDIDHKPTYNYRRWLLEKALIHCSSPIVRDGANLGLSYMDDPHAIPYLKKAIQNEKLPLLRKVMVKTLDQLEDTQKCLCSCE